MERTRYGPGLLALFPVLVFLLGTVPLAASSPALSWLLLLPLAAAVWVVRARVVVDAEQVRVCNGLGTRTFPWAAVDGFDVPRYGPVRMVVGDRRVLLTPLSRADLPALLRLAPARP